MITAEVDATAAAGTDPRILAELVPAQSPLGRALRRFSDEDVLEPAAAVARFSSAF